MAFEQRELSGTLFRNDYKKSPNQPDYRGTSKVGGIEYEMSAWVKKAKNGNDFFSIAFQEKDERESSAPAPKSISTPPMQKTTTTTAPPRGSYPEPPDFDEDIPF
tara:strand:- start:303 stop:617 length:315 start_codon:yes stop_codon:yes gene_type:complete